MPEEIEVPTEQLHEHMSEAAEHEGGAGFSTKVALSAAIFAVIAAIGGMFAGHAVNEALILQIRSSDQWAFYQAKSIKSSVLESKMEMLKGLGKKASDEDVKKQAEYKDDMDKIKEEATGLGEESEAEMARHIKLARAVTFFQIAIALSAIAVMTKKRPLWLLGIVLGLAGLAFLALGFA
jgi:hypothetical protein